MFLTYHPCCTHVLQNLGILHNDLLLGSCGHKHIQGAHYYDAQINPLESTLIATAGRCSAPRPCWLTLLLRLWRQDDLLGLCGLGYLLGLLGLLNLLELLCSLQGLLLGVEALHRLGLQQFVFPQLKDGSNPCLINVRLEALVR